MFDNLTVDNVHTFLSQGVATVVGGISLVDGITSGFTVSDSVLTAVSVLAVAIASGLHTLRPAPVATPVAAPVAPKLLGVPATPVPLETVQVAPTASVLTVPADQIPPDTVKVTL